MDYSLLPAYILYAVGVVWFCIQTVFIFKHGQRRLKQRRLVELSGIVILLALLVAITLLPSLVIYTITVGPFEFPAIFAAFPIGAVTISLSLYLRLVEFVEGRQNKTKTEENRVNVMVSVWPPPPSVADADKTGKTAGE